jgi:hypothetical protein
MMERETDPSTGAEDKVIPAAARDSWRSWLMTGVRRGPVARRRVRGAHKGLKKILVEGTTNGGEGPHPWQDFSGVMVRQAVDEAVNTLPAQQKQVCQACVLHRVEQSRDRRAARPVRRGGGKAPASGPGHRQRICRARPRYRAPGPFRRDRVPAQPVVRRPGTAGDRSTDAGGHDGRRRCGRGRCAGPASRNSGSGHPGRPGRNASGQGHAAARGWASRYHPPPEGRNRFDRTLCFAGCARCRRCRPESAEPTAAAGRDQAPTEAGQTTDPAASATVAAPALITAQLRA